MAKFPFLLFVVVVSNQQALPLSRLSALRRPIFLLPLLSLFVLSIHLSSNDGNGQVECKAVATVGRSLGGPNDRITSTLMAAASEPNGMMLSAGGDSDNGRMLLNGYGKKKKKKYKKKKKKKKYKKKKKKKGYGK